jgi:hypothetical protein
MPTDLSDADIPGGSEHARKSLQNASELSKHAIDLLGVGALHDEQALKEEERGVDSILNEPVSSCASKTNTASSLPAAYENENHLNDAERANNGQNVFGARHGLPSSMRGPTDGFSGIRLWCDNEGFAKPVLDNSGDVNVHTDHWRGQQWSTKTGKSSDEQTLTLYGRKKDV